ncbi:DUF3027 domain-containing protein [Humibacter albus]|uniref:DUF3027 domain-containing protein n=1 Tax=Humibacter albus TaxID=427754 RepID=UPI0003B2F9C8|nr:DUF3027 domain-containing protein [Humibacter albus]
MSDTPDKRLLEAHDVAKAALLEITPSSSVGRIAGHVVEGEHVLSLLFECRLLGYPGWHWTVTLARVDEESEPVVLEAELLPGDEALLAPDWVPWSERLAEYQAAQEVARAAGESQGEASHDTAAEGEPDGDGIDEDETDEDDDLDGVDIDGVDVDGGDLDGVDFEPHDEEE